MHIHIKYIKIHIYNRYIEFNIKLPKKETNDTHIIYKTQMTLTIKQERIKGYMFDL